MLAWSIAAFAAAVLAGADRERAARGAGGLVLLAFGGASLYLGAGTLEPERLARLAMTAAMPPWFFETNLALMGLGVLLAVAGSRSWLGAAVGVAVVASLWPTAGTVSLARTAAVLVGAGMGLVGMALIMRTARTRIRPRGSAAVCPSAPPSPRSGAMIVGAGLLALASPWAAGTLAAGAAAFVLAAARSRDRLQRLVLGASGFLTLAGLGVWALAGSPASPEAPSGLLLGGRHSVVLAGLLLMPSAVGLAAWPVHRLASGWPLLPAALALVGRIGPESIPLGLAWWLPLVFPVAIAGVVRGLLVGEWTRSAGSLAWVGLWIGTPESRMGALLLGITVVVVTALPAVRLPPKGPIARILWVAAGVGMLLVFRGGLTTEVVYTALLALGVAAALASVRIAAPEASA